jgi:hypothetical protein
MKRTISGLALALRLNRGLGSFGLFPKLLPLLPGVYNIVRDVTPGDPAILPGASTCVSTLPSDLVEISSFVHK